MFTHMLRGVSMDSRPIDEAALQTYLEKAGTPRLRKFVARKIPSHLRRIISPEDILQETLIAAYNGLPSFRSDGKDALDRWITSIAQHILVNAIKSAQRVKRGGNRLVDNQVLNRLSSLVNLFDRCTSPGRSPSSEAAVAEASNAIHVALVALPDDRRRAIWLRFIEGKTRAEVASTMNKSGAAVNSLLYHGLRQMQERLGSAVKYMSDAPSKS